MATASKKQDYECENPQGYMARYCGKHSYKTALRCRNCDNCSHAYYFQKRAELKQRAKHYLQQNNIKKVYLWTLGTSLLNTPDNVKKLSGYWKKFNSHSQKKFPYDLLVRVYEAGTKGNRLHVHFITSTQIPFFQVRQMWGEFTNQVDPITNKPYCNVNYSTPDKSLSRVNKARISEGKAPMRRLNPLSAIMYLAKYLTKAKFGPVQHQISRAYYIGKPLWDKFSLLTTSLIKGFDDKLRGNYILRTPSGKYKQFNYWVTSSGQQENSFTSWINRTVPCKLDCSNNLIVKAYSFEMRRDPKKIRKILSKKIREELFLLEQS